jgi:hypothetical protein
VCGEEESTKIEEGCREERKKEEKEEKMRE